MAAANLYPSERPLAGGPRFALPNRRVVLIGVLTFLCFASEGAVTDWSALYLTDVKGADPGTAFQGYAAFASAMALCRLFGDPIVARLGQKIILAVGGSPDRHRHGRRDRVTLDYRQRRRLRAWLASAPPTSSRSSSAPPPASRRLERASPRQPPWAIRASSSCR